jgi:hypothetical protein
VRDLAFEIGEHRILLSAKEVADLDGWFRDDSLERNNFISLSRARSNPLATSGCAMNACRVSLRCGSST